MPTARSPRSFRPSREAIVTTHWRARDGGIALRERAVARDRGGRQGRTIRACVLGLRDYVDKNGFPGVVLGLSGGIDSALCAAIAVDALGAERVRA